MGVSCTNSRTSIASARRADTKWVSLSVEQRIRSIELDGYVVIPDLLKAGQLDAIRSELSRLPTTAVDYSEHQRGCSNVPWSVWSSNTVIFMDHAQPSLEPNSFTALSRRIKRLSASDRSAWSMRARCMAVL